MAFEESASQLGDVKHATDNVQAGINQSAPRKLKPGQRPNPAARITKETTVQWRSAHRSWANGSEISAGAKHLAKYSV